MNDKPDTFSVDVERPELWRVTFDHRPTNLVDPEMILELPALVGRLETDGDVKVVIFDSGIPDHFLGPYDLSRASRPTTSSSPPTRPSSRRSRCR